MQINLRKASKYLHHSRPKIKKIVKMKIGFQKAIDDRKGFQKKLKKEKKSQKKLKKMFTKKFQKNNRIEDISTIRTSKRPFINR